MFSLGAKLFNLFACSENVYELCESMLSKIPPHKTELRQKLENSRKVNQDLADFLDSGHEELLDLDQYRSFFNKQK